VPVFLLMMKLNDVTRVTSEPEGGRAYYDGDVHGQKNTCSDV
jgi:hypothetical protein